MSLGLDKIMAEGLFDFVHPQCKKSNRFFAGTDAERADAFVEMALDPKISVIWLARGGYGVARTLPLIAEKIGTRKPPSKLLIGYSDATALHEYVGQKWGWSSVYAPMPGVREFLSIDLREWWTLVSWIKKIRSKEPWKELKFVRKPKRAVVAPLVGGNLTCFTSMIGTPYQMSAKGKIIFFEEVDEALYRIDRMIEQIKQSGALRGAMAIVLGNFLACTDRVGNVLRKKPENLARVISPRKGDLVPLRPLLPAEKTIHKMFGELGKNLGIPVGYGLPSGHGPGHAPLPLGAKYRLTPQGEFKLVSWEWFDSP
ncbi:MAG: LD-carboxypeptidase [Bdellovibrionota bacterium]